MLAIAFGVPSEVWMYRQASLMSRTKLTVMTGRYDNSKRFPAQGFDVSVVQGRMRLPRNRFARDTSLGILARVNQRVPGLAMSPSETRWWIAESQQNPPDVALAQFGTNAVEMLPLMKAIDVPLVAHFHGFDLSRSLSNNRYRRLLTSSVEWISKYVVVAEYMREALLELGIDDSKIVKIPCGTPIVQISRVEESSSDECRFLAVGRFVDKKRPDLTIRAFASVVEKNENCRLVMIGDGPMWAQCQRLAASLDVKDRVAFLGSQPEDRVKAELTRASVFVQHSCVAKDGDKEGWPVSIAEAASHALPVVATRHASIPEQIPNGVAGWLCDEGDWKTMSQQMLRLANDPVARFRMGQEAKRCIEPLCVENQVALLEDVLITAASRDKS